MQKETKASPVLTVLFSLAFVVGGIFMVVPGNPDDCGGRTMSSSSGERCVETNSSGLDMYSRTADEQRAKNSQNQIGLTVGGSLLILMGGAGLVLLVRQRR